VSARVVLVPGVPALLPEYAGLVDPVADLRAACRAAVSWLAAAGRVEIVAPGEQGRRVAAHLLAEAGATAGATDGTGDAVLVVGNGSAKRTEKAPGHLDERAAPFDRALAAALMRPDPVTLAGLDPVLARELWADTDAFGRLAELLTPEHAVSVDYDDDPFGVQYWVMRWTCES
jgi:hypothetical protein